MQNEAAGSHRVATSAQCELRGGTTVSWADPAGAEQAGCRRCGTGSGLPCPAPSVPPAEKAQRITQRLHCTAHGCHGSALCPRRQAMLGAGEDTLHTAAAPPHSKEHPLPRAAKTNTVAPGQGDIRSTWDTFPRGACMGKGVWSGAQNVLCGLTKCRPSSAHRGVRKG